MPFVIGTDEAGYGPNLGPLVVTATVWQLDDGVDAVSLYKHLRRLVTNCVDRATKKKICWADSKAVYKNGSGLDRLERGVLSALALIGRLPRQWSDLWQWLDPQFAARIEQEPWHSGYTSPLPLWMEDDGLAELTACLQTGLAAAGVRLVGMFCRAVFPCEFNSLVETGNKADALSRVTLALVGEALSSIPADRTHVFCDKHGGRDYYLPLLQQQFPDDWIEVRRQTGMESCYRFGGEQRPVEIGFYVGGEKFLPVALASMTSKYVRETAMRPFNEFWCGRVPGLKPTAGYPVDSRRFKKQIAGVQQELGIDDRVLWRSR
jgi:ribonuclease HII